MTIKDTTISSPRDVSLSVPVNTQNLYIPHKAYSVRTYDIIAENAYEEALIVSSIHSMVSAKSIVLTSEYIRYSAPIAVSRIRPQMFMDLPASLFTKVCAFLL